MDDLIRLLRELAPALGAVYGEALATSEWWPAVSRIGAIQIDRAPRRLTDVRRTRSAVPMSISSRASLPGMGAASSSLATVPFISGRYHRRDRDPGTIG